MRFLHHVVLACATLLVSPIGAGTADTARPLDGVHYFRLSNGLQLVVALRAELPLVAVNTTVDLGAVDDPPGQWGIAHLLEHVTLQGSTGIGSLDPQTEAAQLDELDRAYSALDRERRNPSASPGMLAGLERWFENAQQVATKQSESGEILGSRLEARGAIGLNATTSTDATQFFTWIPPESVELWLALEADRLSHPILRRFFSERSVVLREVEMLTGGRTTLAEQFLHDVFPGGAVAHPLAGDLDQIAAIDRKSAFDYFNRFYRPENIVIGIVGNVDPQRMQSLCERYFAAWQPTGPHEIPRSRLHPPPPLADVRIHAFPTSHGAAIYYAFPRDSLHSAALEALAAMINSHDVSPLYQRLVQERALASTVGAVASYPSQKQPPIFLLRVHGRPGVSAALLEREVASLINKIGEAKDEDLQAGILGAEMHLASQLDDPPTLASLLAFHQAVNADWSLPFRQLERLRQLEAQDLRLVAHALSNALDTDQAARAGR